MEGFATGFSLSSSTKPGFLLENEKYKIQFKGVMCDETKNIVSHGFEYCYDWKEVMELVLAATLKAGNDNITDIEEAVEDAMRTWMTTFQGWGLLSSILPAVAHRHVVLSLAYASFNWNLETGGDYSEEKVFDAVKLVYDNIEGKQLKSLLPKFGVWFEEIVDGGEREERNKKFTVFFNAKWLLEVKFIVEKKRVNRNLLELAAEAAVRAIERDDEIENLDIPPALFGVVRDKFRDTEWVRNYWRLKAEIEDDEDESSVQELTGKLVWPVNVGEVDGSECDSVGKMSDDPNDELKVNEKAAAVVDEVSDGCDDNAEDVPDFTKHEAEGMFSVWLFLCLALLLGVLLTDL
eukprot:GFUD01040406.1.p1 GENE.GFUD01040406.1~~GFUD01040406.1.p1  ORF type:complete len:349 (-),score=106.99 GFUD01040406.1:124-1170(-)